MKDGRLANGDGFNRSSFGGEEAEAHTEHHGGAPERNTESAGPLRIRIPGIMRCSLEGI